MNIDRSDNNYFILEEEVKDLFFNMGYRVDSQQLEAIDIRKLEMIVYNNPSAKKAEVFTTIDGKVKIDLLQRKPVLRIFNESGESFYIDEEGWLMPLSSTFTSRVLIATGSIADRFANRYKNRIADPEKISSVSDTADILRDLFMVTKYINSNEFWRAQITQMNINHDREIELIPRVGNHTILFGDAKDIEEKFSKLMVFYKEGLKNTGWNLYSHINLKFKDQVVCTKQMNNSIN